MLRHSHALSGGVTGLATGLFLQFPFPQTVALAGFSAGMALLPDLDKCGSSPARCLGFLSEAVAWIIGRLTGPPAPDTFPPGHRRLHRAGLVLLPVPARLDRQGRAGAADDTHGVGRS
jgi:hypothetical protein